jgi:hypothetical protein
MTLRVLTYDNYDYPVIHERNHPKLDDQACFVFTNQEWAQGDDDLIEILIYEGVILHDREGDIYEDGELYDIVAHHRGTTKRMKAYPRWCSWGHATEWFPKGSEDSFFNAIQGRIELYTTYKEKQEAQKLQTKHQKKLNLRFSK